MSQRAGSGLHPECALRYSLTFAPDQPDQSSLQAYPRSTAELKQELQMLWKGFQKPKRLATDTETLTDKYGHFWAQPFERGFGTTIGNALRRVLLSSIEGAAVTAVKIEGVLHEFQSIPGVV
jgi:hypothetical protein